MGRVLSLAYTTQPGGEQLKFDDLFKDPEPPSATIIPIPPTTAANGTSPYGAKALQEELSILANTGPDSHKRNDQLNISAFKLATLVASGHLDQVTTQQQLRSIALMIGLTPSETDGTLRSAFNAGTQQPRNVPELKVAIQLNGETPNNTEDADANAEKAAAQLLQMQVEQEVHRLKIRELARQQFAQAVAGQASLPPLIRLNDFLAEPDQEQEYLIDQVWPKGGRIVFSAQYKSGKSTARDNAVRCLVDGEPFLGKFNIAPFTDGTIVVIDDELHPDMMRRWMRDQGITNTDRVIVIPMRGHAQTFDITLPEVRTRWATTFRENRAAVVLLDCLRPILDALGLSEDKDAGKFLVAFDEMLQEAGVQEAMVVHHMGHGAERSRGDSRILDWPDATWTLVREDPEDPSSPRYFKAFGRDVDVRESLLSYDEESRRLTVAGGSRKDAAADQAWPEVKAYIQANPDCSANAIEKELGKNNVGQKAVRQAIRNAANSGELTILVTGPGLANLHSLPTSSTSSTSSRRGDEPHLVTSSPRYKDEVEVEVPEANLLDTRPDEPQPGYSNCQQCGAAVFQTIIEATGGYCVACSRKAKT